jgi:hypothetical protein
MPFAFIDGFDDYPVDINQNGIGIGSYWIGAGDQGVIVPGRFGNQALRKRRQRTCYRGFPSTTQVTVGFAVRMTSLSTNLVTGQQLMGITSTNFQTQWHLGVDDLGNIRAQRPGMSPGETFATPAAIGEGGLNPRLLDNTWHFLEMELVLGDGTAGRFRLLKDGDEIMNLVGIDTRGSVTDTDLGRVYLQANGDPFSNPAGVDFDDFFVKYDDATAIGGVKAKLQSMTADQAVQFARLTGASNSAMINEISADSDTSYNSSNTVGHKDIFEMQDITETPTKIHAVQVSIAAKKDDAGDRTIRPLLIQGATTSPGVDHYETTDYTWNRQIWELNPKTGAPWTKADINAMKVGYELTL